MSRHWLQFPQQHKQPWFAQECNDQDFLGLLKTPLVWGTLVGSVRSTYRSYLLVLRASGLPVSINGTTAYIERGIGGWLDGSLSGMGHGSACGMRSAIRKLYVAAGWDQPQAENARLDATISALQRVLNDLVKQKLIDPKTDYGAMTHDLYKEYFLPKARAMLKTAAWKGTVHTQIMDGFNLIKACGLRANEVQFADINSFCDMAHKTAKKGTTRLAYVTLAHKQSEAKPLQTCTRFVDTNMEEVIRALLARRKQETEDHSEKLLPEWDLDVAKKFFSAVTDALKAEHRELFPSELKWTTHCLRNGAACDAWESVGHGLAAREAVRLCTGHADTKMVDLYRRTNKQRLQDHRARTTISIKKQKVLAKKVFEMGEQMQKLEELEQEERGLPGGDIAESDLEVDDEEPINMPRVFGVQAEFESPFADDMTLRQMHNYIAKKRAEMKLRGGVIPEVLASKAATAAVEAQGAPRPTVRRTRAEAMIQLVAELAR